MTEESIAASYVLKFINQTKRPVFLTGRAGTGKTTLLREIINTTHKNTVVVAPTGIAALNAGGVTIHSMFQLPFATFLPDEVRIQTPIRTETPNTLRAHHRQSSLKKTVIRKMELLVIDEVSMLRPDLLDAIDQVLKHIRRSNLPYGGAQVLFIGDLLQLPPVIKDDEWRVLSQFYRGKYFFHSRVSQSHPPLYIELSKIYRQTDEDFISVLNRLRNNSITPDDQRYLNQFYRPNFELRSHPGYIILTTHNAKADATNAEALGLLSTKPVRFFADITGDFPQHIFPVDQVITLKVGSQVMFVKNDPSPEKLFYNGKIGVVKELSSEEVKVHFPDEDLTIGVDRYEWENIRYKVDPATGEIQEEVIGTFVQYPLKLAWAITIHKSQGLTFDKAALDVSRVFMPGQAYVALSRLRSTRGLILLSPMRLNGIASDEDVLTFAENRAHVEQLESELVAGTMQYLHSEFSAAFQLETLLGHWRFHLAEYDGAKAGKLACRELVVQEISDFGEVADAAQRFRHQLAHLFQAQEPDLPFICQRVLAATDYLFPRVDRMEDTLWKIIHTASGISKSKLWIDSLIELEELTSAAALSLLRIRALATTLQQGKPICREHIYTPAMAGYRHGKKEKFGSISVKKLRIKKQPKKSTYEETLEMFRKGMSINEIAVQRNLGEQTIAGHIARWIREGEVLISDVMPPDRQEKLRSVFEGYDKEVLGPLKEKLGDTVSWDELKFYQAHATRASAPPVPQE